MTWRTHGIAVSLVVLALVLGAGLWRYVSVRPKPVVESRRIDAQVGETVGSIHPTAREVLERKSDLHLTEAQVSRLVALEREWLQADGPLEAQVREKEAELLRFIHEGRNAGRGNLTEIQRRMSEQGELFATYRARRVAHAAAVQQVLTEEQRVRWTTVTSPKPIGEQK